MFVSKEEALAAHQARHKLRTTKAGFGWVFCPYVPGAEYSVGHYVREARGWEQCPGEGTCHYHHLRLISKIHVPALVVHKPIVASKCEHYDCDDLSFRPENWSAKLVELTAGCIETFNQDSKPDQLALCWRDPGRDNGPLHLRWLRGCLKGVPRDLANLSVKDILPAIIHGQVVIDDQPSLDNSRPGRIKHNSNSKNGDYNDCKGGVA